MSILKDWRILATVTVVLLCAFVVIAKPINRGLDLASGTHFTIQVLTDNVSADEQQDAMDRTLAVYRNRIDEIGHAGTIIQQSGPDRILVQIPGTGTAEASRIKAILKRQAHLEFRLVVDDLEEPL